MALPWTLPDGVRVEKASARERTAVVEVSGW